jgi:hypothetical protein
MKILLDYPKSRLEYLDIDFFKGKYEVRHPLLDKIKGIGKNNTIGCNKSPIQSF